MIFDEGLHLVTGKWANIKNTLRYKILLRKRAINDQLKTICQAEHSRHRSFGNFITNLAASLIAYSFQDKKPSIKFDIDKSAQLALFI